MVCLAKPSNDAFRYPLTEFCSICISIGDSAEPCCSKNGELACSQQDLAHEEDSKVKEVTISTVSSPSGQDHTDGNAKGAANETDNQGGDRDDEFVEISVSVGDSISDKHQIG